MNTKSTLQAGTSAHSELIELCRELERVSVLLNLPETGQPDFHDLPRHQQRCLSIIAQRDGQRLNDIARQLNQSLPAASRLIERLVQHGLVERSLSSEDRRALHLSCTPRALMLLEKMEAAQQAHLAQCTQSLDPQSLRTIIASLRRLGDAAEDCMAQPSKTATSLV